MINQYDPLIKNATELYLPGVDWRLLKAQLQAESALDPSATSPVGAMGIAQFMPNTWKQIMGELGIDDHITPYNYETAIPAAAYYMQKLYAKWTAPRPDADRYCLALASYNVGFGNMLKAQKAAGGAADYHEIISHLRKVKYVDFQQTTDYVQRIFATWGEYVIKGR